MSPRGPRTEHERKMLLRWSPPGYPRESLFGTCSVILSIIRVFFEDLFFGWLLEPPLDGPMWLPISKYHIGMRFPMSAKSEILDHFWITFWYHFDTCWRLWLQKRSLKKRSNKMCKTSHAGNYGEFRVMQVSPLQSP